MYCKHDSIDTSIYLIFTSGDIDVRCQVDEVAEEESEGEEFPGHHRYIKIFTGCPLSGYKIPLNLANKVIRPTSVKRIPGTNNILACCKRSIGFNNHGKGP